MLSVTLFKSKDLQLDWLWFKRGDGNSWLIRSANHCCSHQIKTLIYKNAQVTYTQQASGLTMRQWRWWRLAFTSIKRFYSNSGLTVCFLITGLPTFTLTLQWRHQGSLEVQRFAQGHFAHNPLDPLIPLCPQNTTTNDSKHNSE